MSNENLHEVESLNTTQITETEEEFSDERVYQVQLEDDEDLDPDEEDVDEDDFDDDEEEEED
jgi:hypothetical protein